MTLIKQSERYRLTRVQRGGRDMVLKESLPGVRHLYSLEPVLDALRAAADEGLLAYPEYLDEQWRAGRLVAVQLMYRYIEGEPLRDALQGENLMPEGTLHPLLEAAAELLARLARHRLSLRDFSQGNLIVTPEGGLVLVDLESIRSGTPSPAFQARALTRLGLPYPVADAVRRAYNRHAAAPITRFQLMRAHYVREPLRGFNQSRWWRRLR